MNDEVYNLVRPCMEGSQPGDAVFTWKGGSAVLDFRRAWTKLFKDAGPKPEARGISRTVVAEQKSFAVVAELADAPA